MNEKFDYTVTDKVIEQYGAKPSSTIAILQGIQEEYRYLPKEIFPYVAKN